MGVIDKKELTFLIPPPPSHLQLGFGSLLVFSVILARSICPGKFSSLWQRLDIGRVMLPSLKKRVVFSLLWKI